MTTIEALKNMIINKKEIEEIEEIEEKGESMNDDHKEKMKEIIEQAYYNAIIGNSSTASGATLGNYIGTTTTTTGNGSTQWQNQWQSIPQLYSDEDCKPEKTKGVVMPTISLENDQIFLLPLNSGYLIIKGNKAVIGGKEYHSFSKFKEVVDWLKENPILTTDESTIAENI